MLAKACEWGSAARANCAAVVHEIKTSQSLPKTAMNITAFQAMNWLPELVSVPAGEYVQMCGQLAYSGMVAWSALDLAKRMCDCRRRESEDERLDGDATSKKVSQAYVASAAALFVLYGLGQTEYAKYLSLTGTAVAGAYLGYKVGQPVAGTLAAWSCNIAISLLHKLSRKENLPEPEMQQDGSPKHGSLDAGEGGEKLLPPSSATPYRAWYYPSTWVGKSQPPVKQD